MIPPNTRSYIKMNDETENKDVAEEIVAAEVPGDTDAQQAEEIGDEKDKKKGKKKKDKKAKKEKKGKKGKKKKKKK